MHSIYNEDLFVLETEEFDSLVKGYLIVIYIFYNIFFNLQKRTEDKKSYSIIKTQNVWKLSTQQQNQSMEDDPCLAVNIHASGSTFPCYCCCCFVCV